MTDDYPYSHSVLRRNLLEAAVEELYPPEATTLQVSTVRTLFNTWEASGVLTIAEEARGDYNPHLVTMHLPVDTDPGHPIVAEVHKAAVPEYAKNGWHVASGCCAP